ncbi:MAG TPA: hypothetical protein VFE53_18565 [Mucilaginibacter sp.]|jgi:hypothetical protein|nr:hypothetical protein [Mucilaginibacter sp.]
MDIFLRAKHWQLFILIIVLPIIITVAVMISALLSIASTDEPNPMLIISDMKFALLGLLVYVIGKMCWQWVVAIRLQRLAPAGVPFKNTSFKIFFWCVIIYYPLYFTFFFTFIGSISSAIGAGGLIDPSAFIWFIAVFPLSLFNTFCMFYCYYYTAKTYKTIELQRPVAFSDFILEAVLIWFFFVGVWIMQPKINEMAERESIPADAS